MPVLVFVFRPIFMVPWAGYGMWISIFVVLDHCRFTCFDRDLIKTDALSPTKHFPRVLLL